MISAVRRLNSKKVNRRLSVLNKELTRNYSNMAGFSVSDVMEVPRLNMKAISLRHDRTGARHVHVERPDNNNVFAIGFKTNPPDQTGLPHILEHLTLCGSDKYPVRDPFFKMLTRSLANFMNAMTGSDYTYYPFATTNHKDFKNLQNVYLDAVYSPLLRPEDFKQEGWRLEHEKPRDIDTPIIYKGVVFNEMKGQVSNPSYLFYIKYLQSIYPSLNSSGGDPAFIPSLKYEDLKSFHDSRYHPSNSFSFSYGDIPLTEILSPLEEAISKFDTVQVDNIVHEPILLESNEKVEIQGPFDPMLDVLKQYKVSYSWIVGDSRSNDSYNWSVLSLLLTNGHSSPFHKALIDSGIGPQYSVNTGLDVQPAKNIFTIGLEGLSQQTLPKLKEAIFKVFKDIAENGIPQEQLDAIINQVEFSNREVQAQFGLSLVHKLFPRIFNDPNALKLLDSEKRLEEFKQRYSNNPTMFQDMIKHDILDKPYFEFIMTPSESFEDNVSSQEQERLKKAVDSLTEEQKKDIFSKAKTPEETELEKSKDDSYDVLPCLEAEDISPKARSFPIIEDNTSIPSINVMKRETGTLGISYIHLLNDLSSIPSDLYCLLPLYADALTNLGTSKHSMSELEQLIRLQTGGVSTGILAKSRSFSDRNTELLLDLNGSALDTKIDIVYQVFREILQDLDYNNMDKLRQLIQSTVANSTDSLSSSGHRYALGHASKAVSGTAKLQDMLSGIEQIQYMKKISEYSDEELRSLIIPKLMKIGEFASKLNKSRAALTYTAESNGSKHQISELEKFSKMLEIGKPSSGTVDIEPSPSEKTHIQLPFQVSYVGVAFKGASYMDPDSAALTLLANLLTHKYMHPEVREKGGAYGGGARYSSISGIFSFYSYRDPNPINTLQVIEKAGEWASSANRFSERNLFESKLSIFQQLDHPMSPKEEIDSQFSYGITDEIRQQRRSMFLDVTLDDISRVAKKYFTRNVLENAGVSVIGPVNEKLTEKGEWKIVDFGKEGEKGKEKEEKEVFNGDSQ